jgi:hypothetical protein
MAYWGLIKRKQRWVITGRGWISVLFGLVAILILAITTIYPFLAVNHPVPGEILVVEGWLPDYALEKAIKEFKSKNYHLLITTGGPLEMGSLLSEYRTYSELAAATIRQLGLDKQLIVAVPAPFSKRDRTFECAVALKKWLLDFGLSVKSLNLYTLGPHARRSRLLFEKALGDKIIIGVIAAHVLSYDPGSWWKYSDGVRTVTDEMVAYIYARFLFRPGSVGG